MPQVDIMPLVNQLITALLQIIIVAAIPVFASVIYKWGKARVAALNSVIVSNHLELIRDLTVTAVQAAEQKYLGNGQGAAKKAFALQVLQDALAAHGLGGIPVIQLEASLEAAVLQGVHLAQGDTIDEKSQDTDKPSLGFNTSDVRAVAQVSTDDGFEDDSEG